jgi:peptide/nickel transport system substrate-binding protein
MRQLRRAVCALLALGLSAATPLAAPLPAHAETGGSAGGSTLTVAISADAEDLNPFAANSAVAGQIFRLTYDYLTDYEPADNSTLRTLATDWKPSADKLTWTFTLRHGVTWSDGKPLTAKDIAFTYHALMTAPAEVTNRTLVKTFASVDAAADDKLVIRTTKPTATMLAIDAPILPAHVWSGRKDMYKAQPPVPSVSSGPYTLTERKEGEFYRLRANPHYWGSAPKVTEILLRRFKSVDTAVAAMKRGEVDAIGNLNSVQFDALKGDPTIARVQASGLRFHELLVNPGARLANGTPTGTGHPALRDKRVRLAIDYAIDRQKLIDGVLGGYGQPGAGYLPARLKPWSWQPAPADLRGFDPAKAKTLLDSLGYTVGAGNVRLMPGSKKPMNLRLAYSADHPVFPRYAEYIKQWLGDIGVPVQLVPASGSQLNALQYGGEYDLLLSGWGVDPDPDYLLSIQICSALPLTKGGPTSSDAFHCDPQYDALYTQQATELDPVKRAGLVHQAIARLYGDAIPLVLTNPSTLEVYRKDKFTGFVSRPGPAGSVLGYWSYPHVRPVATAAHAESSRTPLYASGAAAAAALLVAGGLFYRRRSTRHLRE